MERVRAFMFIGSLLVVSCLGDGPTQLRCQHAAAGNAPRTSPRGHDPAVSARTHVSVRHRMAVFARAYAFRPRARREPLLVLRSLRPSPPRAPLPPARP